MLSLLIKNLLYSTLIHSTPNHFIDTLMNINTQLDENYSQKLAFLTQFTHANVADVIQQAIDFYYEHTKSRFQQKSANERLLHSGFVGCGDAESTLSESYKSEWRGMMEKKHDNS